MSRPHDPPPQEMAPRVIQGDRRALARAISLIESAEPAARELLALLFPHTGRAHIIGITGAPGTGKSTLVNALARAYRERGLTVAIVAVDPSSPFTGGALLGDRLRMRDLSSDGGVFIRSMATRGAGGGLSRMASQVVHALDAAGYERILVETVGAGQDEVEVARLAHTVVVVEAPGLGDDIQAIKAGILETANILVVNKADRDGAEQTLASLRLILELANPNSSTVSHHGELMEVSATSSDSSPGGWMPVLLPTVATTGHGVPCLLEAIEEHRAFLATTGERANVELRRAEVELRQAVDEALRRLLVDRVGEPALREAVQEVASRGCDPHTAAKRIVGRFLGG